MGTSLSMLKDVLRSPMMSPSTLNRSLRSPPLSTLMLLMPFPTPSPSRVSPSSRRPLLLPSTPTAPTLLPPPTPCTVLLLDMPVSLPDTVLLPDTVCIKLLSLGEEGEGGCAYDSFSVAFNWALSSL